MVSRISRLIESLWLRGPRETIALVRKNLVYEFRWYLDRRFDRVNGTDTSDRIELTSLDIAGVNRDQGVYYEPTPTGLFRHMMEQVESALPCNEFVFIDFGSGKGRTLMIASDYVFKAIIGVEFSRELHLIAKNNLSIYRGRHQRCMNLSVIHSDASLFTPPAENLLVYFYNPFLRSVMVKVLENLTELARTRDVKIALVYFNPLSGDVVESCGLFRRRLEIALPHDYSREQQRSCFVYFSWSDAPGATIG